MPKDCDKHLECISSFHDFYTNNQIQIHKLTKNYFIIRKLNQDESVTYRWCAKDP